MNTLNFVVSRIFFAAGVFSFLWLVFCITTEHSEQLKILLALTLAFCSFGIFSELSYRRYQRLLSEMNKSTKPVEVVVKKPRTPRKKKSVSVEADK